LGRIEATAEINASPEAIWRTVLAYERWPDWSPLFQLVEPQSPEKGLNGEWTLNGVIGRVPYSGLFHQVGHRPLEAFAFASIRISPPYDFIRHTVLLNRETSLPTLTWRIEYSMSGGPGGWIVDRLLVRRGLDRFLDRAISAIENQVQGDQSPPNPNGRR
jgi:Polyketide cyclase / dehydrase and lipid transport